MSRHIKHSFFGTLCFISQAISCKVSQDSFKRVCAATPAADAECAVCNFLIRLWQAHIQQSIVIACHQSPSSHLQLDGFSML